MADSIKAAARTRSAIEAAENGELHDARTLLTEALVADRDYQLAWLWFAAITDKEGERKYCLERSYELQPSANVSLALNGLRDVESTAPPELVNFTDPEPPELIDSFRADVTAKRRRRRQIIWGTMAGIAVLIAGFFWWQSRDDRATLYIAVVATSTAAGGPGSGQEIEAAAEWAANAYNENWQLPSYRLQTVYFDDEGDPTKAKEIAEQIVADGRYVAVIGNQRSVTSQAASPVYKAAKLPAITPSATVDSLTVDSDWFFRTVFNNSEQGRGASDYAAGILGGGKAAAIYSDNPYGQTVVAEGFAKAYQEQDGLAASVAVKVADDGTAEAAEIAKAVAKVLAAKPDGPVLVAGGLDFGVAVVKGLRGGGLTNPILVSDSLTSQTFFQQLMAKPNALSRSQLSNIYAATPLVRAGLTGEAISFYEKFSTEQKFQASWEAGLTVDALDAIAGGMARLVQDGTVGAGLAETRVNLRDALAAANTADTAFDALTRPIYFDDSGSAVRTVSFEVPRVDGPSKLRLDSAPLQLVAYSPQAGITEKEAISSGIAVRQQDRVFTVQRIVNVGVNLNEISSLNSGDGTFRANFFLWLRYPGDGEATNIAFPNATNPALGLGEPVQTQKVGNLNYALYRVDGTFKASMNFRDFPFDEQSLPISLQNASLPSSLIAYTPDPELLAQPQTERMESGVEAGTTIAHIPNWEVDSVNFFPRSVGNTSNMGNPNDAAGAAGVTYSQFMTSVDVSRDLRAFLVKNLLPLMLLLLVIYIVQFLPFDNGTRMSFAVTGVLTGAVMLNSVTGSLQNVDYTVAIEWAYYAFILLSAIMLLINMVGRSYHEKRLLAKERNLDLFAKLFFPGFVAVVALIYAAIYS